MHKPKILIIAGLSPFQPELAGFKAERLMHEAIHTQVQAIGEIET